MVLVNILHPATKSTFLCVENPAFMFVIADFCKTFKSLSFECVLVWCYLVTARVHTVIMKQHPTITQPHPPSGGDLPALRGLPSTIAADLCSRTLRFLVLVLVLFLVLGTKVLKELLSGCRISLCLLLPRRQLV